MFALFICISHSYLGAFRNTLILLEHKVNLEIKLYLNQDFINLINYKRVIQFKGGHFITNILEIIQ